MKMAILVSERSTCLRRKVGSVLVKNNQLIASGYNGVPKKIQHCDEKGCTRKENNVPSGEKHELCRGVHAEQNTIVQSALNGTPLENAVLYTTNYPCVICAKMIINAEIETVYVLGEYPDKISKELFKEAGIEVIEVNLNDSTLKKISG